TRATQSSGVMTFGRRCGSLSKILGSIVPGARSGSSPSMVAALADFGFFARSWTPSSVLHEAGAQPSGIVFHRARTEASSPPGLSASVTDGASSHATVVIGTSDLMAESWVRQRRVAVVGPCSCGARSLVTDLTDL